MRFLRHTLGFVALLGLVGAAPQEFASGPTHARLLELFTSEGCSSCPPAEAWLARLRDDPGLWRELVPVAWHFDYWDKLGWKDRFASREATQRQSAYASLWKSGSVYTPCFVLDGKEWRGRVAPKASQDNTGVLRARYDAGRLSVAFETNARDDYEAHAVVLAMSVASKVTRGENRGRELLHEFVAAGSLHSKSIRDARAEFDLPMPRMTDITQFALAVRITRRGHLTPVQATGGVLIPGQ